MTHHTVIDLRESPHEDVSARIERALSLHLLRSSRVHGESGATEGFRSDKGIWVRIERRRRNRYADAWVGLEAAATISGVRKPAWSQAVTWNDPERGAVWRADEMELITAPIVRDLTTATCTGETCPPTAI